MKRVLLFILLLLFILPTAAGGAEPVTFMLLGEKRLHERYRERGWLLVSWDDLNSTNERVCPVWGGFKPAHSLGFHISG